MRVYVSECRGCVKGGWWLHNMYQARLRTQQASYLSSESDNVDIKLKPTINCNKCGYIKQVKFNAVILIA